MSAPSETDYQFILCCLKHSQSKPDFHAVAKELGLKTHMTAYHRHWKVMQKAGVAGNTGKGRKPGTGASVINGAGTGAGGSGKKHVTSAKKPRAEEEPEHESQEAGLEPDGEQESNGEVESPSKKIKTENKLA